MSWTKAPYIHADVLSDVRSNHGLAPSALKELTFYPEKGVRALGTPERGNASGIFHIFITITKKFLKGNSRLWSNKDYSPPGCQD